MASRHAAPNGAESHNFIRGYKHLAPNGAKPVRQLMQASIHDAVFAPEERDVYSTHDTTGLALRRSAMFVMSTTEAVTQ